MAIALVTKSAVNSAVVTNLSTLTTASITTTGASVAIICIGWGGGGTVNVSDNKGNTYTLGKSEANGTTEGASAIYYCFNPTVGAGHTATLTNNSGATIRATIGLMTFSGTATTGLDGTPTGALSGAATIQPGAMTPSGSGALLITASGGNGLGASAITISGGTNDAGFTTSIATANWDAGMSFLIQPGAATLTNPQWNYTGDSGLSACMLVIAASGGAVTHGLFEPSLLNGLGTGGPFFPNPIG